MSESKINTGAAAQPENTGATKSKAFRYGAALPIAAGVTIGLTVSMGALIATEFTPQDKTETASFEINPRVEDLPEPQRLDEPELLKKVETPPPPPRIATDTTAKVELPEVEITGKKVEIEIDMLDFGAGTTTIALTKEPIPFLRIPPVFPNRFLQGRFSGYCQVQFDINAEGRPFNVLTTVCTNNQLKAPTVKSVQKWKYSPEIANGKAVTHSGLETTIQFELQDERGQKLPIPAGF